MYLLYDTIGYFLACVRLAKKWLQQLISIHFQVGKIFVNDLQQGYAPRHYKVAHSFSCTALLTYCQAQGIPSQKKSMNNCCIVGKYKRYTVRYLICYIYLTQGSQKLKLVQCLTPFILYLIWWWQPSLVVFIGITCRRQIHHCLGYQLSQGKIAQIFKKTASVILWFMIHSSM